MQQTHLITLRKAPVLVLKTTGSYPHKKQLAEVEIIDCGKGGCRNYRRSVNTQQGFIHLLLFGFVDSGQNDLICEKQHKLCLQFHFLFYLFFYNAVRKKGTKLINTVS